MHTMNHMTASWNILFLDGYQFAIRVDRDFWECIIVVLEVRRDVMPAGQETRPLHFFDVLMNIVL